MLLALTAALILIPLLGLPGALIRRAALGSAAPLDLLDRVYTAAIIGLLLNGWLALLLAELGLFRIWLHILLIAVISLAAALVAARRGALPRTGRRAAVRAHWESLAMLGVLLLFALLVARPFEVVLGVRDAGVYANTGFAIASSGSLIQADPLVAQIMADKQSADPQLSAAAAQADTNLLGVQNRERWLAPRLRAAGFMINEADLAAGRVTPQFYHLFPAWIALLAALLGNQGGLLSTGLLGLFGVWGVGMLGRRLAGPWVGLLAALLLALNGVQVWFSRYSTSEVAAQAVIFAGLYAFALRAAPLSCQSGRGVGGEGQQAFYALLAGLALGQALLIRIDALFLVAPLVVAYLGWRWIARRWDRADSALGVGFGLMALHAGLHALIFARAYFFDTGFARLQDQSAILARLTLPFLTDTLRSVYLTTNRSILRQTWRLPAEIAVVLVGLLILLLIRRDRRLPMLAARLTARARPWLLNGAALLLVLLAAYAYLIRPQVFTVSTLSALPGCLRPQALSAPAGACLALQGYIGAPIPLATNPDPLAYALDTLLKRDRTPAVVLTAMAAQPSWITELPGAGPRLDQIAPGDQIAVRGRSQNAAAVLVTTPRGATGWAVAAVLAQGVPANRLPILDQKVLVGVKNPRFATSFTPTNPGEAEKTALVQANFVRFGWYLSPLGIALGVLGIALWLRRSSTPAHWLFFALAALSTFFWIRQSYGTSEQTYIYILRRYVPLAYPAFCLGAAYAIVALTGKSKVQSSKFKVQHPTPQNHSVPTGAPTFNFQLKTFNFRLFVALLLALALLSFETLTSRTIYAHTEYGGALEQIGAVAARFQPTDVVLLRGGAPSYAESRDLPDLLATPLRFAFGVNAFTIKSRTPDNYAADLAAYVRRWQAQGRKVYLLLSASGGLTLPGLRAEPVDRVSLSLREFEALTAQKPTNVQSFTLDFERYLLVPATPVAPAELTAADYSAQLRGLDRPEPYAGGAFAWTNGDAQLRLMWPSAPTELTLTLAGGKRPVSIGLARACVSYRPEKDLATVSTRDTDFTPLGCFALTEQPAAITVTLDPGTSAAPPTGSYVLRIASETWVPANVPTIPPATDQRSLGVLFGGLTFH